MCRLPSSYRGHVFGYCVVLASIIISPTLTAAESVAAQRISSDPVEDYLNAIDNTEADNSAYAVELSDLYLGLGQSLFSRREYKQSLRAFQRGMQIERVNRGLNSLSQGPYLLSIADTESQLGHWQEAKKALDNLYSINRQAYGENNQRLLPVLDQMLDWYMNSYSRRSSRGGYENLVLAERIATQIDIILQQHIDLSDPETPDRYRRLAYLQYFIAKHIKRHGQPSETGLSISTAGSSNLSAQPTSSNRHFRRGKSALEKVVESVLQQPGNRLHHQALAIAELGDWYLVYGRRTSAQKAYQLAYDTLQSEPEQSAAALFDTPKIIEFTLDKTAATADRTKLQVSLLVSPHGIPRNVKLVNPPQDMSTEQINRVQKNIRKRKFRPKLQAGQAVEAAHHLFVDQPPAESKS